jgi:hypothetical protein
VHSLTRIALGVGLLLVAKPVRADEPVERPEPEHAPRRRDATWAEIFGGPFVSSRLFAMPTAEVVGAYQLSVTGDASLLTEANSLSTTGVIAIGFGDLAQLEYRGSAAVSGGADPGEQQEVFRLPSVGVQIKAPLRSRPWVPGAAVALRFGLPQEIEVGDLRHQQKATDLYFVSRLRPGGRLQRLTLHGGLRVASARIDSEGPGAPAAAKRTLFLPAGGWEVQMNRTALIAGELALVPLFDAGDATQASRIGHGLLGRAGMRWRALPSVIIDASIGYRIEVARMDPIKGSMLDALVDWDLRLGAEIFIPWGAAVCRAAGAFCE